MPKVGDRVRLDSRIVGHDPRSGVITSVRGQMISVRWSSGEESSIVPGPGTLTVVGRGRAPAKKTATKKAASKKAATKKAASARTRVVPTKKRTVSAKKAKKAKRPGRRR